VKVSQVLKGKKPFSLSKIDKKTAKKIFIYKINNFFKINLWNNNMAIKIDLR